MISNRLDITPLFPVFGRGIIILLVGNDTPVIHGISAYWFAKFIMESFQGCLNVFSKSVLGF